MTEQSRTLRIRTACEDDAPALLAIYAPYVEQTAITFEYEVPSLTEFRGRIRRTLQRYPYLAAEAGGELLGYAYTGPFGERAAYGWAAETSIYLRRDVRHMGLGGRLCRALEEVSRAQNVQNLYACIAVPETVEDAHLTRNSAEFHSHLGYTTAGEFHRCGYKFGTWYGMVWMEKLLGTHPAAAEPLIPFPALRADTLRRIGITI